MTARNKYQGCTDSELHDALQACESQEDTLECELRRIESELRTQRHVKNQITEAIALHKLAAMQSPDWAYLLDAKEPTVVRERCEKEIEKHGLMVTGIMSHPQQHCVTIALNKDGSNFVGHLDCLREIIPFLTPFPATGKPCKHLPIAQHGKGSGEWLHCVIDEDTKEYKIWDPRTWATIKVSKTLESLLAYVREELWYR